MTKEKSKKSNSSDQDFPSGLWPIYIRDGFEIGSLRIDSVQGEPANYLGEMTFEEGELFKDISGQGYNVIVSINDSIPGAISFYILDAAQDYDQNADSRNLFVFVGFYQIYNINNKIEVVMNGLAKVPKGFGETPGPPSDEGDTVNWTSKGHGN
jgi:hypothetical protein